MASGKKPSIEARKSGQKSHGCAHQQACRFRNAVTVFARTATVDNSAIVGVDADLTVRPFSQKGVFASLRQFTINAMNAHHGMQAS